METQQRSRITNGKPAPGVDGRSSFYRRRKDLTSAYLSDLGGPENVSVSVRLRVELVCGLIASMEETEAKLITGQGADADREYYRATAGNVQRLLNDIDKDCAVTPTSANAPPADVTPPDPLTYEPYEHT